MSVKYKTERCPMPGCAFKIQDHPTVRQSELRAHLKSHHTVDDVLAALMGHETPSRPKTIQFTAYLHGDSYLWEHREEIAERTGVLLTDEDLQRIGRPFYEVSLQVEIDLESGETRLLEAKL